MNRIDELIDAAETAVDEHANERAQALAQIATAAALASIGGHLANVVANLERLAVADNDPLDGWTPVNVPPPTDGAYLFITSADSAYTSTFYWRSGAWWDFEHHDHSLGAARVENDYTYYRRHPFA